MAASPIHVLERSVVASGGRKRGRFSQAAIVLSLVVSGAVARSIHGQCEYGVTVIQPAPCPIFGILNIQARAVSDAGHVVGWRPNCALDDDIAYLWTASGGMVDIPFPAGTSSRRAEDVNASGIIVGSASFPNDGMGMLAFVYNSVTGTLINLGTVPGGNQSEALAVNEPGQVVGWGQNLVTGNPPFTPFIWQDGVMTLLELPVGPQGQALDINDDGGVVGWMGQSIAIDSHAVLWQAGVAIDIGKAPGAFASEATAINDRGEVLIIGFYQEGPSAPVLWRSFVWERGVWTDIGLLPGSDMCAGLDLNDAGQVVGYCTNSVQPNVEAFLWQDGVMICLDDLLPEAFPGSTTRAFGISQPGLIIATGGYGLDPAALLLGPLDQPLADLDHDCTVGYSDFLMLLNAWGACAPGGSCAADLDGDGTVGVVDFLALLANWTP
jgi:probable HAF family extracellular repeat protein